MATNNGLPEGTDSIITGAARYEDEPARAEGTAGTTAGAEHDAPGTTGTTGGASSTGAGGDARGAFFAQMDALTGQATDRARDFAETGKARATAALDDLVQMVEQAAGEIDSRLGAHYGDYARRAAQGIGGFADGVKDKDVDQLFADARELVKKSPAIAIGTAAALGFIVARLVRSGMSGDGTGSTTPPAA